MRTEAFQDDMSHFFLPGRRPGSVTQDQGTPLSPPARPPGWLTDYPTGWQAGFVSRVHLTGKPQPQLRQKPTGRGSPTRRSLHVVCGAARRGLARRVRAGLSYLRAAQELFITLRRAAAAQEPRAGGARAAAAVHGR